MFSLQRFDNKSKAENFVEFPLEGLQINEMLDQQSPQFGQEDLVYDLYGTIEHTGTLSSGHYTANCFNSVKNKWMHFDDRKVTDVDDSSKIVSENAYVLFYK